MTPMFTRSHFQMALLVVCAALLVYTSATMSGLSNLIVAELSSPPTESDVMRDTFSCVEFGVQMQRTVETHRRPNESDAALRRRHLADLEYWSSR